MFSLFDLRKTVPVVRQNLPSHWSTSIRSWRWCSCSLNFVSLFLRNYNQFRYKIS